MSGVSFAMHAFPFSGYINLYHVEAEWAAKKPCDWKWLQSGHSQIPLSDVRETWDPSKQLPWLDLGRAR